MKYLLPLLLVLASCVSTGTSGSPVVSATAASGQLWVHTDGINGVAFGEGYLTVETWIKGVGLPVTETQELDSSKVFFWEGGTSWTQGTDEPWPDWAWELFLDTEAVTGFLGQEPERGSK